jgi:UDP-3-O-[3-hydroxymyristoyl] glucosamine N-acyltransferase
MTAFTTQALAEKLDAALHGPGDIEITGLDELDRAGPGQLTFIGENHYAQRWPRSHASAALLAEGIDLDPGPGRALLVVPNADDAMRRALELFAQPIPRPEAGIHRSAVVDPTAEVAEDAAIGPFCHIGPRAVVGPGTVLHGGVTLGQETTLGQGCELWPGVVVRERCTLGDRVIAHPNAVIGADGFGFRQARDAAGEPYMAKMPQVGTVELGADVELGAGTCIDRGKFAATVLGKGCKLDNLVQIGHNCHLGQHVTLAACCAVGGSVTLGDWVLVGGGAMFRDHVTVGPRAQIAGAAKVVRDLEADGQYAGGPAKPHRAVLRELSALEKLPDLVKQFQRR